LLMNAHHVRYVGNHSVLIAECTITSVTALDQHRMVIPTSWSMVLCMLKRKTMKRYHEEMYDRTTGRDRAYHYAEWRKIVSKEPIVTDPKPVSALKRHS